MDCLPRCAASRSVRFRPVVELLEDRLTPSTFLVTNTQDTGSGSLRQAISSANSTAGANQIQFNIPTSDPGYSPSAQTWTISVPGPLTNELPTLTGPVTIDGTTQPGYAGSPVITLRGPSLPGPGGVPSGLVLAGGNSTVTGLTIGGFTGTQIALASNGNVLTASTLGGSLGFQGDGVSIGGNNNTVGGTSAAAANTISNNGAFGVVVTAGNGNTILGNSIFSNTQGGISLTSGTNNGIQPPQILRVFGGVGGINVSGRVVGKPNTTYTVQFFDSTGSTPSNILQGKTFLKQTTVTTNSLGVGSFTQNMGPPTANLIVTTTATDPSGNTSQFSQGPTATHVGIFNQGQFVLDANGTQGYQPTDPAFIYGLPTDTPVTGDWLGIGVSSVGVFRQGLWVLDSNASNSYQPSDLTFTFGAPGDIPVTGDWLGNGVTNVGVVRVVNGALEWILDTNGTHQYAPNDATFFFGAAGDIPVTGDWAQPGTPAFGKGDVGVFRQGTWILDQNQNFGYQSIDPVFGYGLPTDQPVTGDWNGLGVSNVGVYRSGTFVLNTALTQSSNFQYDSFIFGAPGDIGVSGSWAPAPQMLAGLAGDGAAALSADALGSAVTAALQAWRDAGLPPDVEARLVQTQFVVAPLSEGWLGMDLPGVVEVDSTADGHGWNTDPFAAPRADQIDLVSVVAHELGHELGLRDGASGVMTEGLPAGVRRLPTSADVAAYFALAH